MKDPFLLVEVPQLLPNLALRLGSCHSSPTLLKVAEHVPRSGALQAAVQVVPGLAGAEGGGGLGGRAGGGGGEGGGRGE